MVIRGRSLIILVVCICVIVAGLFLPAADLPNLALRLQSPSFDNLGGTDQLGRDVLGRTLRAIARSSSFAFLAWGLATYLGASAGIWGAIKRGRPVGKLVDSLIKIVYSTPFLLVVVGLGSLLGRSEGTLFVAILAVGWVGPARHARAVAREALESSYVLAAEAMGYGPNQLSTQILLPVVIGPVLVASGAVIVDFIALDMALTLFGFGPSPPAPTLGSLLSDGLRFLGTAPWMAVVPLIVVCGLCLGIRVLLSEQFGR